MDDLTPPVAVIMPVLNEEQHLAEAVAAITGQDLAICGGASLPR